jgi:nucleoside-diphosphate-sugar epimerase
MGMLSPSLAREACVVPKWTVPALREALQGSDIVIHTAAVMHRRGVPAREYEALNVEGTQHLVDASHQSGVRRLLFTSSIKVYGEEPDVVMDEKAPLLATLPYATTKIAAERICLDAAFPEGQVVLRLAPVYGVGDKGNVRNMLERIARGRFAIPGTGDTLKSLVHIRVVVDALERAALWPFVRKDNAPANDLTPALPSGVYVASNADTLRVGELADLMAELLGKRPPVRLPNAVLFPAARLFDLGTRLVPKLRVDAEGLVRKSQLRTVCDSTKLRTTLGVDTKTDMRADLEEEIAWLRRIGTIRA